MERLGQFEILEAKLQDEVTTTQSNKKKILVKVKGLQNKIASVTTDITDIKDVKEKPDKNNEIFSEASKHQTAKQHRLVKHAQPSY